MLQQIKTRRIVTACAALCVGAATLTLGPVLTAQQSGGDRTAQMDKGMDEKLSPQQTDKLMAEMKDMQQSLSSDADRKELETEIAEIMCQMQLAKELMKEPGFKQAMKETMATPEGKKMQDEMKQLMMNHEQIHADLLADPATVRGTVIMAKAMAIAKDMEKGSKKMDDGKKKTNEGEME